MGKTVGLRPPPVEPKDEEEEEEEEGGNSEIISNNPDQNTYILYLSIRIFSLEPLKTA